MSIQDVGWDSEFDFLFEEHRARGRFPARVIGEDREGLQLHADLGDLEAVVASELQRSASRAERPTVGDWVAAFEADGRVVVDAVLARRSRLVRRATGGVAREQVIAANVDYLVLVMSLNNDFNVRRAERYLTAIWDSGAKPVIVLTKTDLVGDAAALVEQIERVALDVPIHPISVVDRVGLEALEPYVARGTTIALVGSSGAGKSTLANYLFGGDVQETREIRDGDERGVHTTTGRRLLQLPGGALVVDTPGMRTFGLWGVGEGLETTFADVIGFAENCRFRDCSHGAEPGCGVRGAIGSGALDAGRYASFVELKEEAAQSERDVEAVSQRAALDRWKRLSGEDRARGRAKRR